MKENIDAKYLVQIYIEAHKGQLENLIRIHDLMYSDPDSLTIEDYGVISEACSFVFDSISDLVESPDLVEKNIEKELQVLYDAVKGKKNV